MASGKRLKNGEELASERSLASSITEKAWQATVRRIAEVNGWHEASWTWNSRHSAPGWVDLFLLRSPRAVAIECKTDSPRSKVTLEQEATLSQLKACGIEAYVFRPSQVEELDRVLLDTRCVDCGHEPQKHGQGKRTLKHCWAGKCRCAGYRPRMAPQ